MRHLTRRHFLQAGAVVAGTVFLGGRDWRSGPSAARAQTLALPVVDRLAVRVVVDNVHDVTVPGGKIGNVEVQRVGWGLGPNLGKELHSEFGLGFHLESRRGSETRGYLLDYGASLTAEMNNLDLLKIDTASLDALILSHGHFDHFAGLVPLLTRDRAKMRRNLPLYLGGEDTFCHRWAELPSGQRLYAGALDRRDLRAAHVRLVQIDRPAVLEGHAFTTGPIPRVTFEKPGPAVKVEIGMRDGAGCDASHFSQEERDGKIVADRFRTEHATCFNVKDRGLVVLSSCGHAGIVNAVKQAQAVSGEQKVHAVIGGFHLAPTPEAYQAQVVQAFKEINPDWLIPMHCSGATFARLARESMPGKVIVSCTGTRFIFGA